MKKIIGSIFLLGALYGCATQKQPDPLFTCIEAIKSKPQYNPLRNKMSLGSTDEQTIAMLANKEFVTDSEKPLVLSWANERQACIREDDQARVKVHPAVRNLFSISSSMTNKVITDLYTSEITYGEFAQRRQKITDALRSDLSSLEANAMAQDDANRRQVLLMQLQSQLNRPSPAPMPAPYMTPMQPLPVNTNCTTIGNQVNCTSR